MGSRWLDPSEVAKGPPLGRCRVCIYPRTFLGMCAFDASEDSGSPAVLPPSPLVAAPRWNGKPPRVLVVWPDKRDASARWEHGRRPTQMVTKRVAKVRDWHEPVAGCFACDGYAKLVLA